MEYSIGRGRVQLLPPTWLQSGEVSIIIYILVYIYCIFFTGGSKGVIFLFSPNGA